jgi:ribosomal protein S18 acetylase RimI-like enzyme
MTVDPTNVEIAEAADANFAAHASWALQALPNATVINDAELVVTDSGLACDTFNIVCRARLKSASARARVEQTVDYFSRKARAFSWWFGPADRPSDLDRLLIAAGLRHTESETMMSLDLAKLRTPDLHPEGLHIKRVRTPAELAEFAKTVTDGTAPDPEVRRFYQLTANRILSRESPQHFYIGYLDGKPIATAEVTLAGDVAGIYGVVTLEQYRRRGIGSALTARPLIDARDIGYRTGVLQASADGLGVYRRLGFQEFGVVREFKPVAPS